MTKPLSTTWYKKFQSDNLAEAQAIDDYIASMPATWQIEIDRLSAPVLERGNRVARRYKLREKK